jgi:uncharacterized protein YuzE
MKRGFAFEITVETNDQTGEVLACYLRIREGQSAKVKEYADGNLFADYDRKGRLLGMEILGPCKASVLSRIAETPSAKRFVRDVLPKAMLAKA